MSFDVGRLKAFAQLRHSLTSFPETPPLYADPVSISMEARQIAELYFQAGRFDQTPTAGKAVAAAAATMIYALERYAMTHELLCDQADEAVAETVASVTADPKLPPGRRMRDSMSRISQAPDLGQIARFAEIRCVARGLARVGDQKFLRHCDDIRRWIDDMFAIVGCMRFAKGSPKLEALVTRTRERLAEMADEVDARRRDLLGLGGASAGGQGDDAGEDAGVDGALLQEAS